MTFLSRVLAAAQPLCRILYMCALSNQIFVGKSMALYEFAWAAISKRTLTTVLAAVKLEDAHRIPDPSIELSPVQIQEGPFFETPCVNHNHVQTAMETAPILPPEPHVHRYNGELRATPMTSLSQETLAAGIDTTPSASSTQYVTPATETPSANNSQQEMLHPAVEAFAPDETTPDTSADNGFTEIGETLIGTVRLAPEDVVVMQETTTKR
ncbi:hypothetical protein JB92DRAFT_2872788 [Gautieria morchelliformis]|nr:hypothetical protein JB92DRAFT_2872788 [Gautieria morchelliformis]